MTVELDDGPIVTFSTTVALLEGCESAKAKLPTVVPMPRSGWVAMASFDGQQRLRT